MLSDGISEKDSFRLFKCMYDRTENRSIQDFWSEALVPRQMLEKARCSERNAKRDTQI